MESTLDFIKRMHLVAHKLAFENKGQRFITKKLVKEGCAETIAASIALEEVASRKIQARKEGLKPFLLALVTFFAGSAGLVMWIMDIYKNGGTMVVSLSALGFGLYNLWQAGECYLLGKLSTSRGGYVVEKK